MVVGMSPRRLVALLVPALLISTPVVFGKTSHAGWPRINGIHRRDSHDRGKTYHGTRKSDELLGGHGNNSLYGKGKAPLPAGGHNTTPPPPPPHPPPPHPSA